MSTKKFRFYITDLFSGCIKGTDDETKARDYAACEDYFVVDTTTGLWLSSGSDEEIGEMA